MVNVKGILVPLVGLEKYFLQVSIKTPEIYKYL
jgi:hypothetical protein